MRPFSRLFIWVLVASSTVGCGTSAPASPASMLGKALARYMSTKAASESAEKVTKELGEATVERVALRIVKDSGEEGLERVSQLVVKYGPDVIHAIDNTPAVSPLLKALDDVPADQVATAVARLAAGQQGKELAETTLRYGAKSLRAEIAHPGVGGRFVRALGDDGASLCSRLSTDEAIALGRHMDGIAALPASQRQSLLDLINKDKDRFFAWLAAFMEKNPGKTIGSVTFLAVFLPNSERILGGDEILLDKDGNAQIVRKPGLAGQVGETLVKPLTQGLSWLSRGVAIVVVAACAAYASIKLWGIWRRERRRTPKSESPKNRIADEP